MSNLNAMESAYVLGLTDDIATEGLISNLKLKRRVKKDRQESLDKLWNKVKNPMLANLNNLINGVKYGDEWHKLPWNIQIKSYDKDYAVAINLFDKRFVTKFRGRFKDEDLRACYYYVISKLKDNFDVRNTEDDSTQYRFVVSDYQDNIILVEMVAEGVSTTSIGDEN